MSEKKKTADTIVVAARIEEHSTLDGRFMCIVCGMRYEVRDYAEICCKKIAGIENLGGRRQHRWR